ncbi:MAG: murein biosynthesis integral membrane protein MurJ [Bacteriovoracaceae bacterium]|nr:murein biosynthesis integral membrane protein MurJ [Bacteriovoracaceae bacterium]
MTEMQRPSALKVFFSSLKMAIATFLSRIFGLVREQVMAALFGASSLTDAFLIAFRIPNLMRDLFAEGAFSSAFVPTFVEAKAESQAEARNLMWALFIMLSVVTGILSLLIFIFAPELVTLFAPTYVAEPEKLEITVNLTRIMSPYLLLVSLAALFMGALNSLKVFFVPALAPVFLNISMIVSMFYFPGLLEEMGRPGVYALGIGATVGGLLQSLVQVPALFKKGFAPLVPYKIIYARSVKVFKLLGPGLLGFAATQLNLLITTILASGTVVGAVSWLSYAFRLFQLPIGILGVSIGNSHLVHFSEAWKTNQKEQAVDYLASSYFLSLFTIFPAVVGLYAFSDEIVHIIYERGQFNLEDTKMTALALKCYALGMPFYSLSKIFVPSFYAIERQSIPVYSSIASIIFNIIFCLAFTEKFGFAVLAVGTSLSMLVGSLIQGHFLMKNLSFPITFYFGGKMWKLLLAALSASLMVELTKNLVIFSDLNFLEKLFYLAIFLFMIVFTYGLCLYILGERKIINELLQKIRRKFSSI